MMAKEVKRLVPTEFNEMRNMFDDDCDIKANNPEAVTAEVYFHLRRVHGRLLTLKCRVCLYEGEERVVMNEH